MRNTLARWGVVMASAMLLAACGGGGGGGSAVAPTPTAPVTVQQSLAAAAANPANDTSTNPTAAFDAVQAAGVPVVVVNSPPKVNFTVFSNGAIKQGLTLSSVSFALAKLIPGTNGNPDEWVNYISRTETAAAGVGPGGVPVLATARQATFDAKHTDPALAAGQLVFNPEGYYTYTFRTDIKDPTKTAGVTYEPGRTHRVAIQLSFTNAAGETIRVNPYHDFTLDANGNSVPVTNPALTRKMTDVSSCNSCHEKLALHGGGRVDTQFCVMCHNPGTTDANSGNNLNLATMVHKIHAGKLLHSKMDSGGEHYQIWGFGNAKHDFSKVGFPQDLRNCTKCHSGDNPNTPQGDNWKTMPTKQACLTCHASGAGSEWEASHRTFAGTLVGAGAAATDLTNAQCANCHRPGSNIAPERVHFNQNEDHAPRYKMNIESAVYDAATRKVTIQYFLSDPTNGNAAYNLITPDCTSVPVCSGNTRFGNLRFFLAYQSMVGQPAGVTEFTSYNNGGSSASVFAYLGTNDGNNRYTAQITVPPDTATHVASGTARVISVGQIKEPKLQAKAATDPRPEVVPRVLVNVAVQHTSRELPLTGALQPRRQIVATEKCNACHGFLGTTSASNLLSEAFHSGARNIVEACVLCHDANRMSSTKMTNGLDLNESYQFKRMIHAIHGNSKRTYPFTNGNRAIDAFNMDGTSKTGGAPLASNVRNYAAEVQWPGVGINCNACHVDNSYKVDQGPVGAVVTRPTGVSDPMQWLVISPKAATCTSCHDSSTAMGHVTSFGNASFGNRTQAQSMQIQETCADCHSSGGFKGVDIVHGQK